MSSAANAESNTDPWSHSSTIASNNNETHAAQRVLSSKAKKHVPDAWDDDDDENDEETKDEEEGVDNATLWQDANTKQPMPEVILNTAAPLPTAALQQPMRILKRPSPASASPSLSSSAAESGPTSLKDREAAYQTARARIFGLDSTKDGNEKLAGGDAPDMDTTGQVATEAGSSMQDLKTTQSRLKTSNSKSKTGSPSEPSSADASVSLLRNPRGPPSSSTSANGGSDSTTGDTHAKGFGKRRGRGGKAPGVSESSSTKS